MKRLLISSSLFCCAKIGDIIHCGVAYVYFMGSVIRLRLSPILSVLRASVC